MIFPVQSLRSIRISLLFSSAVRGCRDVSPTWVTSTIGSSRMNDHLKHLFIANGG